MKNILVVAVVLLLGTGCTVSKQEQAAKNQAQPQMVSYTNTVGKYTLNHPEYLLLSSDNQPATEESNPLVIVEVSKGQVAEEDTPLISTITVEDASERIEDKITELKQAHFSEQKDISTATTTVGGKEVWEIKASSTPYSAFVILHNEKQIIVYDSGNKLVQSLQFNP